MKLLTKTSLHYLWVSTILLLAIGLLLFSVLKRDISAEIKEQLELQVELVAHEIKQGITVQFPLVKIEKGDKENTLHVFKDTLIYDPLQRKQENYFLLTQSKIINKEHYRITVLTTYIGWAEYFKTIIYMFIVLATLLVCAGGLVNYLISRNVWRPFLQNMSILKLFSVGRDQELKLVNSDINEFEELNAVMKDFAAHARREYKNLQEFSENASHELQTPITIIRTRLERISQLTLDTEATDYLVEAKQSLERLSKVNKGLLLLTKLEHDDFPDKQVISLSGLINEMIDQFKDLFISRGLSVKSAVQSVMVNASPHLVNIMVSNLLSNMCRYTKACNDVEVLLQPGKMEFINQGEPLQFPEGAMFKRFNKNNTAQRGIGLGLSIIKQICIVHGWTISYRYQGGRHIFSVSFV